jgi:putative sterol carrier protein
VATLEQCEDAFEALAGRLAATDPATRSKNSLDRTLCCTLNDLDVVFGGRIKDGLLIGVRQIPKADAQVKLTMSSDDLLTLVAGNLNLVAAWTTGRVKIDARVFDLIKLRSIF